MSRSLQFRLPVLAVAIGALLPAAAHARPSLEFNAPCYSPGDAIAFSGSGYTPNGEVNMFFAAPGRAALTYDLHADAGGAITDRLKVPDPDDFMDSSDDSAMVGVSANDRTKIDTQGPGSPEEVAAFGSFELSRFGFTVSAPGGNRAISVRKPMRVEVTGYTGLEGKPAFMHYRRAGRTLKTVRLGTLRGSCGNLDRTLPRAFPFRPVPAGSYKLVVNTSAASAARGPWTRMTFKVSRRDAVR